MFITLALLVKALLVNARKLGIGGRGRALLPNGIKLLHCGHIKHAVGRHGRAADG
jgi:hypothetical protein